MCIWDMYTKQEVSMPNGTDRDFNDDRDRCYEEDFVQYVAAGVLVNIEWDEQS